MIHPDTELQFINKQIGYGVIATRLIPRGTITWVRDDFDQPFSTAQVEGMPSLYRGIIAKYCFVDARGDFVLCWDLARYMNHSCAPSCRSAGYDFELAVRNIQPGEELTDDYGSLNLEYDFTCSCGSAACRKQIRPGDLIRYAESWDQIVAGSFPLIPAVSQPLWPLVKEKEAIESALAGRARIASCRENYHAFPGWEEARPPFSRS
ncbi:MAG: SET domain-containing protein [Candidatus Binatia bacterium]